jgi:uncharacterized protein (TIRG00374 family)
MISMGLEALRTKIIARAQGIDLSSSQMLAIDLSASFYSLFLPAGTISRGAVRIYRLSKLGVDSSTAALVIFRDRLESTAVMAVVGLGFFVFAVPSEAGSAALLMMGACVAAVIVYLIVFAPIRWPIKVPWQRFPAGKKLEHLRQSIGRARKMPLLIQLGLLVLSLVMHLFIVLTFYSVANSLGLDVSLVTIGWVRSAVTLITMLPITLGGIGLRETAMLLFLTPYGVQEAQAVAFAFLIFIFVLLIPGLLGGLVEGWFIFIRRGAPEKSTSTPPDSAP